VAERRVAPAPRRSARARRTVDLPLVVRPIDPEALRDEAEAQRYRSEQAGDLANLVRARTARMLGRSPNEPPEAAANQTFVYLQGWLDGVMRLAPDLVDELALEVEQSFCAEATSAAELIVMSRVVQAMPELANPGGFECLFARSPKEDAVLWAALDAFQLSGLPKSPTLERIEQNATDPRTKRRFLSPEAQRQSIESSAVRTLAVPTFQPPQPAPGFEATTEQAADEPWGSEPILVH
jgi:hypothetical protein